MLNWLESLRELTLASVVLRLLLAVIFGGLIGIEREQKQRPAGFRTYLLVCLGAALAMLLGEYFYAMERQWKVFSVVRTDVSRLGAQVISGIGFLGAGTILVTESHNVRGLNTAAGLWASACMGLAVGAGFYECILLGFLLLLGSMCLLPRVESWVLLRSRGIGIYVEVCGAEGLHQLVTLLEEQEIQLLVLTPERRTAEHHGRIGAVLHLRLPRGLRRERLLLKISTLDGVWAVREL